MIALCVSLNGQLLCTAGAEDLSVLNAIRPLGPKTVPMHPDEIIGLRLRIGGLTHRGHGIDDDHLAWPSDTHFLNLNDRIEVQIIDMDQPTPPDERRLCDAALHETNRNDRNHERFLKAKETSLRLKSQFEPG